MSVETEPSMHAQDAAPPADPGANPALVGLPVFIVGATALGLFLVGYRPAGATGALLSIIIVSSGLGLAFAAAWAARLGAGPLAAIFGTFSGFWLSLAAMVFGSTHGWFGATSTLPDTLAVYALCWLVVVGVLTLGSLRLPMAITALLVLVDVVLLLVLLYAAGGATSTGLATTAGYLVFAFTLLGIYLFLDAMNVAAGGRAMPMGSPVLRR